MLQQKSRNCRQVETSDFLDLIDTDVKNEGIKQAFDGYDGL
jgi:hypothetical protein